MQFPITGSWSIQIQDVRPFTIHGDIYYEIHAMRRDDGTSNEVLLRVPEHACKSKPLAGQRAVAIFLMGQVTSIEPE